MLPFALTFYTAPSKVTQKAKPSIVVFDGYTNNEKQIQQVEFCQSEGDFEKVKSALKLVTLVDSPQVVVFCKPGFSRLDERANELELLKSLSTSVDKDGTTRLSNLEEPTKSYFLARAVRMEGEGWTAKGDCAIQLRSENNLQVEINGRYVTTSIPIDGSRNRIDLSRDLMASPLSMTPSEQTSKTPVKIQDLRLTGEHVGNRVTFAYPEYERWPSVKQFESVNVVTNLVLARLNEEQAKEAGAVDAAMRAMGLDSRSEKPFQGEPNSWSPDAQHKFKEHCVTNWRSFGFASKDEAERQWKDCRVTQSRTLVSAAFAVGGEQSSHQVNMFQIGQK